MIKFTETHDWILVSGDIATIGITAYAQKELGEIVYVELPRLGHPIQAGDPIAVLESTKAAVDIYAPVSGEIVSVNESLRSDPGMINTSPQSQGWLYTLRLSNPHELDPLMDQSTYTNYIK